MVAAGTGRNQIFPGMHASQVAWDDMINGQVADALAAVLACVIVAAQDFPLGQAYMLSRALNHVAQADYGWSGESARDSSYYSSPV